MPMATVGVEQLAKIFRVSPRQVQKFADSEGMPRVSHGKYDPFLCMAWFIRRLHKIVCGCSGPCEGLRPFERNMANTRAERKMALAKVGDLADELADLS